MFTGKRKGFASEEYNKNKQGIADVRGFVHTAPAPAYFPNSDHDEIKTPATKRDFARERLLDQIFYNSPEWHHNKGGSGGALTDPYKGSLGWTLDTLRNRTPDSGLFGQPGRKDTLPPLSVNKEKMKFATADNTAPFQAGNNSKAQNDEAANSDLSGQGGRNGKMLSLIANMGKTNFDGEDNTVPGNTLAGNNSKAGNNGVTATESSTGRPGKTVPGDGQTQQTDPDKKQVPYKIDEETLAEINNSQWLLKEDKEDWIDTLNNPLPKEWLAQLTPQEIKEVSKDIRAIANTFYGELNRRQEEGYYHKANVSTGDEVVNVFEDTQDFLRVAVRDKSYREGLVDPRFTSLEAYEDGLRIYRKLTTEQGSKTEQLEGNLSTKALWILAYAAGSPRAGQYYSPAAAETLNRALNGDGRRQQFGDDSKVAGVLKESTEFKEHIGDLVRAAGGNPDKLVGATGICLPKILI